jgi:hypothetical protein
LYFDTAGRFRQTLHSVDLFATLALVGSYAEELVGGDHSLYAIKCNVISKSSGGVS